MESNQIDPLPEKSDMPPAPPQKGKRELAVCGSEIYLPDSRRFSPGDEDFANIVKEVLPDYAPSLSEEALRRPRGYSAGAIILILLFFGILVTGLFYLRPQVRLETTSMDVPPPEITRYSGEFSREYKKAMDLVKSEKFGEARKQLEPIVDQLLERKKTEAENEPIFYSYFCLFKFLQWDDEAGNLLNRLIRLNTDYRWKLFGNQYLLWRMGGERLGKLSDHASVDSLYEVMGTIDDLRRLLAEKPELTRQLDLYKCYFGLKVWRRLNYPVPNDERGLKDREEVWKIASRYPNDIQFSIVRLYLVDQLIRDDPKGYYIFDEKRYFLNSRLIPVRDQINREIAKQEKKQ